MTRKGMYLNLIKTEKIIFCAELLLCGVNINKKKLKLYRLLKTLLGLKSSLAPVN